MCSSVSEQRLLQLYVRWEVLPVNLLPPCLPKILVGLGEVLAAKEPSTG